MTAGALLASQPASADCTIAAIDLCTINDPGAAERLLLGDLGDGRDPVKLYRLGRHYWMAPQMFRDPVRALWYVGRAANLGYDVAIAALATMQAEPAATRPPAGPAPVSPNPADPIPPDPPSTLAGIQLTIDQVMRIAFEAGFRTEDQLLAAAAMAISESSLWTAARNWKPELGFRPATDVIGVPGPAEAWRDGRQMHSDRGLWQISSWAWSQYADRAADDPLIGARAAFVISKQGTDFSPWASFVTGHAQTHYDREFDGWPALRPVVRQFLEAVAADRIASRLDGGEDVADEGGEASSSSSG